MPEGIAVVRGGHTTWLKWHRARKTAGDLPFTAARILEGLRLGASVEVDLVRHAGGGFAVLHDFVLDRATTGTGRVADTPPEVLRTLFQRDGNGNPTAHHPMLFEDLCALIAAFHAAGKRIDAYTLTSADAAAVAIARRLLDLRADQITTDDPVGLEKALETGA